MERESNNEPTRAASAVAGDCAEGADAKSSGPRAEYGARLRQRQERLDRFSRYDAVIANARLAVFLLGGAALAALLLDKLSGWWLLAPLAGFVSLMIAHELVIRRKERALFAVEIYTRALARLDGDWAGRGNARTGFAPDDHPYAADLDLFGVGSLFERVCMARTRAGEEALARYFLEPAAAAEIAARQAAVADLRPRLDLREVLLIAGGEVHANLHPQTLIDWATAPAAWSRRGMLFLTVAAAAVTAIAVGAGLAWALGLGPLPLAIELLLAGIVQRLARRGLARVLAGTEEPERELRLFASLMARLADERFTAARLGELQRLLAVGAESSAARCIKKLAQLVTLAEAMRNQLFAPIGFALMWRVHFALAIERWRSRHGPAVREWLGALGELEALSSLAAYAYECPADPLPEIVTTEGPLFAADGLGHPLLPQRDCVRNDVHLGREPALWVVSGSNMSGKSTLLRTVGISVVLAQAGAPVRAERLRLSPLQVGATIRIQDSLQAGASRFYAEIRRLKQLVDMAYRGSPPLIFLLDEILHGTNSHDRRIGAEGLLEGLLAAGAIGLVTTHDLALAAIADGLGARAVNVHLEDKLVEGKLLFDYRVKPGVVEHSNALALMRAVGLRV